MKHLKANVTSQQLKNEWDKVTGYDKESVVISKDYDSATDMYVLTINDNSFFYGNPAERNIDHGCLIGAFAK